MYTHHGKSNSFELPNALLTTVRSLNRDDCKPHVRGFKYPRYRKFHTRQEAWRFVLTLNANQALFGMVPISTLVNGTMATLAATPPPPPPPLPSTQLTTIAPTFDPVPAPAPAGPPPAASIVTSSSSTGRIAATNSGTVPVTPKTPHVKASPTPAAFSSPMTPATFYSRSNSASMKTPRQSRVKTSARQGSWTPAPPFSPLTSSRRGQSPFPGDMSKELVLKVCNSTST